MQRTLFQSLVFGVMGALCCPLVFAMTLQLPSTIDQLRVQGHFVIQLDMSGKSNATNTANTTNMINATKTMKASDAKHSSRITTSKTPMGSSRVNNRLVIQDPHSDWLRLSVKNKRTLILKEIQGKAKADHAIPLTLHLAQLRYLNVQGSVRLRGRHLQRSGPGLTLVANSLDQVQLIGVVPLTRLVAQGSGLVSVRWVSSPRLNITGQAWSHIKLAGRVGKLRAQLNGHSHLEAQNLRATDIWALTQDSAIARVFPTHSLRAFAENKSNIYYYKKPVALTRVVKQSGNVLQLDWKR